MTFDEPPIFETVVVRSIGRTVFFADNIIPIMEICSQLQFLFKIPSPLLHQFIQQRRRYFQCTDTGAGLGGLGNQLSAYGNKILAYGHLAMLEVNIPPLQAKQFPSPRS